MKANILEFFYEHIDEDDWLEGLDLYQAGKVAKVEDYHGLLTSSVGSNHRSNVEVRLKIHPSGRCIQWIECTCRKNRTTGHYCEHMAAFMISIDREKPQLLGNLDSKMPLKPPMAVKGRRINKAEPRPEGKSHEKQEGAAQTILTHLEGSIHSVSLLAHGPTLRARLEIKPGQLTHYDLPLDAAAKFIIAHPKLKTATPEVRELKVYASEVFLGTRIYQIEDERIQAERVIAIKHTKKSAEKIEGEDARLPAFIGPHKFFSHEHPDRGKEGIYELFTVKAASRFIGKEYFFVPGRGYWPLPQKGLEPAWNELPLKKSFKEDEAARLVEENYKEFIDAGPIFLDPNLHDPIILETPKLSEIKVHMESDGWFFLDPRYGSGSDTVSMIDLMRHARKKRRSFLKSGNVWLKIPDFVKEHDWALDDSGQYLKVDAIGLMRLKAAIGDFDQFVGSKKVLNEVRNRLEFTPSGPIPELVGTRLTLREYQVTGLQWLWWLYQNSMHGLLADEMGLGKTHQAMALMSAVQKDKPEARFLVIAPTTVLDHWEDKIRDFCPNLVPLKHHGPKRGQRLGSFERANNTLVTSYGVLLRDIKELSSIHWDAIILDEAHFVKNNDTATYQAVCRLKGSIRICLTGTPMENNLGELKNIFDFLIPGYLGSDEYFKREFQSPIEQGHSPEKELALQKLIHPFKMRRTKDNVLKDLPAKVEDIRHCALSADQAKLYRNVLAMKASPLVEQLKNDQTPIPYLHVFATLTMLKQICDHPLLLLKEGDYRQHESGKFELLKEILEEALGSGHKVVIYSQYVSMIRIFEEYLKEIGVDHATLTGQTRNRGKVIARFQEDPSCRVFCGSLLAGGIGIDLTAASVVVHYDRWWNATKESQATDRVHRIGQNKNVQVLKLITRGTLEEKIDQLINTKRQIFEKFMDQDEEVFKSLTREDLIDLLQ